MATSVHLTLHPLSIFVALAAGLIAGAVNTVAAGGSILTFPTLIWLGLPPVIANTTNNVGIWPGNLSGTWGMRRELLSLPRQWLLVVVPALLGGTIGAITLLRTPSMIFAGLAPWLILGATLLIGLEPTLRRLQQRVRSRFPGFTVGRQLAIVLVVQFCVSIYGGYFGTGMGLIMLTVLGLVGHDDLHANIGLKNLAAIATNGIAIVVFVLGKSVIWPIALVLATGTLTGGWLGAQAARKAGRERTRHMILAVGIFMSLTLMVRLHAF